MLSWAVVEAGVLRYFIELATRLLAAWWVFESKLEEPPPVT